MKRDGLGLRKAGAYLIFALLVVMAFASAAHAQRPEPGAGGAPTSSDDIRVRQSEMIERESLMNASKQPAPKRLSEREQKQILKQLKEDYEGIQSARNELLRAVKDAIDYRRVQEQAAEINKRAGRLREVLALPHLDDVDKETEEIPPVKALVAFDEWARRTSIRIGNRIKSFVTSPYFQNPSVIDPGKIIRASRDLKKIIELSERLKEEAKRR